MPQMYNWLGVQNYYYYYYYYYYSVIADEKLPAGVLDTIEAHNEPGTL